MISIKASSAPISKNSRLTHALPVSSVREGSCHCSRRNLSTAKWEWCWSPCVFRLRAKENIECRVALGAGHILEWRSCFPSMLYLDDFGCTGTLWRKYLVDYPHQHFARDQYPTSSITSSQPFQPPPSWPFGGSRCKCTARWSRWNLQAPVDRWMPSPPNWHLCRPTWWLMTLWDRMASWRVYDIALLVHVQTLFNQYQDSSQEWLPAQAAGERPNKSDHFLVGCLVQSRRYLCATAGSLAQPYPDMHVWRRGMHLK